ncbi:hypothetical protein DL764_004704 [Monosporascus ibericus]|uniref:Ecp2 effector protein domain-containing protein n=1 Tax=Monosporascus ibericus TaxID=155417 RepID=A0A4Q4TEG3_9PEZI|nr:hypothetical protein DL764_004704 [Monosporascus ibericus]
MAPLSKFGIALSAAASVSALGTGWPTQGSQTGEIRVYSWDQDKQVGCLTSAGKWTASPDACDTFKATSLHPITLDVVWTELEIETSAGSRCWSPDSSTMELGCDASVSDTLWLHSGDFQADVLVHGRPLDSYVPLNVKAPTGGEAIVLKSVGQSWDGDNYQLIWVKT